jgi:hypothetical protein
VVLIDLAHVNTFEFELPDHAGQDFHAFLHIAANLVKNHGHVIETLAVAHLRQQLTAKFKQDLH